MFSFNHRILGEVPSVPRSLPAAVTLLLRVEPERPAPKIQETVGFS
jgi:hypothetical protein